MSNIDKLYEQRNLAYEALCRLKMEPVALQVSPLLFESIETYISDSQRVVQYLLQRVWEGNEIEKKYQALLEKQEIVQEFNEIVERIKAAK